MSAKPVVKISSMTTAMQEYAIYVSQVVYIIVKSYIFRSLSCIFIGNYF